jgi:hypothetical protein
LQIETHFGAISHVGTTLHILLTQFEIPAYGLYIIQLFSIA